MGRFTIKDLRGLLCSAFEGGSNYWYMIEGEVLPPKFTIEDFSKGGKAQPKGDYWHWAELIPTVPGCALLVSAPGEFDTPVALNLAALRRAEEIMREKYPRHWADAKEENGDAITGDVFLQCALYGEVIFG